MEDTILDVLQLEDNLPAMSLMLPWTNHASLLLLRTAAVELHLDFESLEWENQAGLELLLLPIENGFLLCTFVLDLVPIWLSIASIDLNLGA